MTRENKFSLRVFDGSKGGVMTISIIAAIVITFQVVDMMLGSFFGILQQQLVSLGGVILYTVIVTIIYIVGQYFLLNFAKHTSREFKRTTMQYFVVLLKITTIVQYVLAGILLFMILQIATLPQYYFTSLMVAAIAITSILTVVVMGLLGYTFFSWHKSRKSAMLFFYGLAAVMAASFVLVSLVTHSTELLEKHSTTSAMTSAKINNNNNLPSEPRETTAEQSSESNSRSLDNFITIAERYIRLIPSTVYFIAAWAGTVILLYKYSSQRIGKVKFWVIICLPLIFYLVGKFPAFSFELTSDIDAGGAGTGGGGGAGTGGGGGAGTGGGGGAGTGGDREHMFQQDEDLLSSKLLFKLSTVVGSILFGFAFFAVQKGISGSSNINDNHIPSGISALKDYLALSAYGITMVSISLTSPVLQATFPPFGFSAHLSMALASYLFFLGLYSAAVRVSHDATLRKLISDAVEEEQHHHHAKLLDSIGTAQLQNELEKKVIKMAKDKSDMIEQQYGVKSSLTEEGLKEYLRRVLEEVREKSSNERIGS
jgi:hypothetical protein